MGIFHRKFRIDSRYPVDQAWRRLLPVVKTDFPLCTQCGDTANGGVFFCSHCGQAIPPPLPPPDWITRWFSTSGFEFEGDISPREFNISRIIWNRNPCTPVIKGRFEPTIAGTAVVIEMKMHPMGYLFLIASMGFSFLVLGIVAANTPEAPAIILLSVAAPCFFLALCWITFTVRANLSCTTLSRLWENVPEAN